MTFHNVSVPFGNLLSLTLASLSYGLYFVLFLVAMYLSLNGRHAWGSTGIGSGNGAVRRPRRLGSAASARIPIVLASVALFITATSCWILTVYRNFRGWIFFDDGKRPAAFFDDPGDISAVVQNAFVALSIVFGDCIIVYRLWLVWRKFSVLVLPVCSILGLFISSAIVGYQTGKNDPIAHVTALTPFVAFNIITNVYCTACIAYKILAVTRIAKAAGVRVARYSRPSAGERLTHLVAVFVESAAGYTIIVILYMILHQLNHNLQYAVLNIVPNALGAANALITARVALGRSIDAAANAEDTAVSGEMSIQFAQINTGMDTQTDPEASRVGRGGQIRMDGDDADEIKSVGI